MAKFLSDEWFRKVKELVAAAGNLDVSGPLKDVAINLNVTLDDGAKKAVHMAAGLFHPGAAPSAPVTLSLPASVAKKMFIDFDGNAAMTALQAGQLGVAGDVSKLMALQSVRPSAAMRKLLENVQKITE